MSQIIFYDTPPNSDIIFWSVVLVIGLLAVFIAAASLIRDTYKINHPEEYPLLIVEADSIILFDTDDKKNPRIIPWGDLMRIHWEDYSVKKGKSSTKHESMYFEVKSHDPESSTPIKYKINSRYVGIPMVEVFIAIRQYYKGPIVKERSQGVFENY